VVTAFVAVNAPCPASDPAAVIWITAAFRHGRLHLSRSEREHFLLTGQETDMTRLTNGIRDLTADEIGLVAGGQTWAYEIRSADGVLDVGMRLDKATGREVPYAIWTAAAQ
jgi:hypothetical protein